MVYPKYISRVIFLILTGIILSSSGAFQIFPDKTLASVNNAGMEISEDVPKAVSKAKEETAPPALHPRKEAVSYTNREDTLGTLPTISFPALYRTDALRKIREWQNSRPFWAASYEEMAQASAKIDRSPLLDYDILAYYGHPNSRIMGILGRFSKEEINRQLTELAKKYEAVGHKPVKKAFYIIYGTVWPGGDIGIISRKVLEDYINYAQKNNMLVFIDHQIGRYEPIDCLKMMLPYLRYPNVNLALDPEWRTTKPMAEFGYITGNEINRAQEVMEDYMEKHHIPGERMLVIHQFRSSMIVNRKAVRTDFKQVRLVHCADGFGAPHLKRDSYAQNALARNMPIKGFKLFYNFGIPGAGFDKPLLTPAQVYALKPRPYVIMYQ
jgi:hypothetical protein